jgi:nucleoside-diphosphate-sugar epimerase
VRAVVTGGLGFVGGALARHLRERGDEVVVYDAAQGDEICDTERLRSLVHPGDVVFHLAAVRGSQGEQDFDLALRVNLDGSRAVLEACRAAGDCRFVFASTLAVFDREGRLRPQTTYGMTKAAVELLLADYRRKGFVDARAGRLATVVVRPDAPAQSASGFASAIFRESLAGRDFEVPVLLETRMPVIGVRTAVECFVRLAELPADALGDPVVTFPSLSVTVAELAEAAARAGGTGRLDARPDPVIQAVVGSWPAEAPGADGFPRDESLDAITADYLADARV